MHYTQAFTTAPDEAAVQREPWTIALSVEAVAYVVLATVALAIRLFDAAWMPLDPTEAGLALPAWQAAAGHSVAVVPGAPLLFGLQQAVFWLGHGGDAAARLVPALAGVALVLASAGLRPLIGRPAALGAATLFAVGGLWTFFGRNVSSVTLSAALLVLLIGLVAAGGRPAALWLPIVAALLVAAGGAAYAALIAALLWWLGLRLERRDQAVRDGLTSLWPDRSSRRTAALAFAVTLVLAATGLLLRPEGFAALVQEPARWLASLPAGVGPAYGFLLPLGVYAPVTLCFGLAGVVIAWRGSGGFGRFLVTWVLVGGVIGILGASPAAVAVAALPLTIAAGCGLGALASALSRSFSWREDGVMTAILLVVAAYCLLSAFAAANPGDTGKSAVLQLGGGLAVFLILALVYGLLWGGATTLRVLGLTALIVGTAIGLSNSAHLSFRPRLDLAEPMRPSFVTPDGDRLTQDLAARLQARQPASTQLSVVADPALQPWLAWRLRDMPAVRWAKAQGTLSEDAVITPSVAEVKGAAGQPAFGPAAYMGRDYLVSGNWQPIFATIDGFDIRHFLRWLLVRGPAANTVFSDGVAFDRASLYLKVEQEVNP